jgi:hypothetical protein
MAKTQNVLKLSDILDSFNESMSKLAEGADTDIIEDEDGLDEGAEASDEDLLADPEARQALVEKAQEALAELAENVDADEEAEADEDADEEAEADEEADEDADEDAGDEDVSAALQELAAKVISDEDDSLEKEASEFGRIFAKSVLDELESAATMQKVAEEAYVAIRAAVTGQDSETTSEDVDIASLDKIATESYNMVNEVLESEDDQPLTKEAATELFTNAFNVIKSLVK